QHGDRHRRLSPRHRRVASHQIVERAEQAPPAFRPVAAALSHCVAPAIYRQRPCEALGGVPRRQSAGRGQRRTARRRRPSHGGEDHSPPDDGRNCRLRGSDSQSFRHRRVRFRTRTRHAPAVAAWREALCHRNLGACHSGRCRPARRPARRFRRRARTPCRPCRAGASFSAPTARPGRSAIAGAAPAQSCGAVTMLRPQRPRGALNFAVTWLGYFVLVARALGPSGYGMVASVFALLVVFGAFAGWGSDHVLIRNVTEAPERFGRYFGNALLQITATLLPLGLLVYATQSFVIGMAPLALALFVVGDLFFGRLHVLATCCFMAFERGTDLLLINIAFSLIRLVAC